MQMVSSLAKDTKVALTSLLARKTTTKLVARAMPAARTKRQLKPLKRRIVAKTKNKLGIDVGSFSPTVGLK
jgi:hypothetical protein